MARPVGVGEHVIVEVVHPDGRDPRVEIARDDHREELAQPHGDPELDREPAPAALGLADRVGDEAEHGPRQLERGEDRALQHDPGQHDDARERVARAGTRRPLQHREGQQVIRRAPREDAAVSAAVAEHAGPVPGLRALHPRGVAAAREVHVVAPALAVVVEARDIRTHPVHRSQLEGRRRARQPDAHRRQAEGAAAEQPREERYAPRGERVLEDRPREPVDLDDEEAAPGRAGRGAEAGEADQAV